MTRRARSRAMAEPERVPVTMEPADAVTRMARALGVDESRVQGAFDAMGLSPSAAFSLLLQGTDEAKVEKLAHAMRVSRARLALALLDSATQGASQFAQEKGIGERVSQAAGRAADRAKEWFFEIAEFVLETFAETIPRILNRITLGLALFGVILLGSGILAIVAPELFLKVVYYIVGGLLVLFGVGSLWLAWKIHEATATLRTLARMARKWRGRWQDWTGREREE
jgi:hypothetical protein